MPQSIHREVPIPNNGVCGKAEEVVSAHEREFQESNSSASWDGVPVELLDHAVRCWEAETVNAHRLAARMNLLLPVMLAVLGLGAFNLSQPYGRLTSSGSMWLLWIVKVLLLGSLVLFMRALWIFLTVRHRARPRVWPGSRLRLPRRLEANPEMASVREARDEVYDSVYSAYLDLRRRNLAEQMRIDRGQQALLLATLHALVAVACYTLLASTLPRSS